MKTFLKIKNTHLAAEPAIIKRNERQWPAEHPLRIAMMKHRLYHLRPHARAAHLAYGFLRGRDYLKMEPTARTHPDYAQLQKILKDFGLPYFGGRGTKSERDTAEQVMNQKLAEWIEPMKTTVEANRLRRVARKADRRARQAEHLAKIRAMSTEEFAAYQAAKKAAYLAK